MSEPDTDSQDEKEELIVTRSPASWCIRAWRFNFTDALKLPDLIPKLTLDILWLLDLILWKSAEVHLEQQLHFQYSSGTKGKRYLEILIKLNIVMLAFPLLCIMRGRLTFLFSRYVILRNMPTDVRKSCNSGRLISMSHPEVPLQVCDRLVSHDVPRDTQK